MEDIKYFQHNECTHKVCVYNFTTNEYEIIIDGKYELKKHGTYVQDNGNIIAILGSEDGPIFVINNNKYVLGKIDFEFKHIHLESLKGQFTFLVDNKIIYETEYDIPPCINYWEEEDDLDLFQALLKYNAFNKFRK